MPGQANHHEPRAFTDEHLRTIQNAIELAATVYALPWYLVVPDRHAIRVYHGGLDVPERVRGRFVGEKWTREIEAAILVATGLPEIRRVCDGPVVEFRIPPELFAAAATAVRMEFDDTAGRSPGMRGMLLKTTLPV